MTIEYNDVYEQYYRMIEKIASNLYRPTHLFSMEDLAQVGHMSATKVIRKFDESKGVKLSTFLTVCVRRDMVKFIKKHDFTTVTTGKHQIVAKKDPQLWELIPDLPAKEQQVLQMKAEGYKLSEISKSLNQPISFCKKVLEKCVKSESYS